MRLDGVTVLDMSRLLPGPYATQLLAYTGADVIKIEDPEFGDYARNGEPRTDDGIGAVFDAVNRGKRSITLDLKTDEGREILYRLVQDADVVLETFRPGVTERLGASYDVLRSYNDDLVYCSLTGYGQDGPYADQPGHDINYIGVGGLLGTTRKDQSESPRIPGFPIADMGGGLFAAFAIVGALLSRELGNGGGQYIDVAMTDVVASFSQLPAAYVNAGIDFQPGQHRTTGGFACYNVYETADGKYLSVGALEPRFWREFCETIDREELINDQFPSDEPTREAVIEAVAETISSKPREQWLSTFEGRDVAVAPVNDVGESFDDPQIAHRTPNENGITRVGLPLFHAGSSLVPSENVPERGEHTHAILRAHGFSNGEIDSFEADGII